MTSWSPFANSGLYARPISGSSMRSARSEVCWRVCFVDWKPTSHRSATLVVRSERPKQLRCESGHAELLLRVDPSRNIKPEHPVQERHADSNSTHRLHILGHVIPIPDPSKIS